MIRFQMTIRKRLLLTVLSVVLLTYCLSLGYLIYRDLMYNHQSSLQNGRVQIAEYATQLRNDLNISLTLARDLSGIMEGVSPITWDERIAEFRRICERITHTEGYDYSEIVATFDYKLQNPTYPHREGQYELIYPFSDTLQLPVAALRDTSGFSTNISYFEHRNQNEEEMLEPYLLRRDSAGKVRYVVGVSVPVHDSLQRPVGVITINRAADYYRKKFLEFHPYNDMSLFLFSRDMKVIAGPEAELMGQDAENILSQIPSFNDKVLLMRQGTFLAESYVSPMTGQVSYIFSAPIRIGTVRHPWTLCMSVSREALLAYAASTTRISILIAIGGVLLLFLVIFWLSTQIGGALRRISKTLTALAQGHIDSELRLDFRMRDEIGVMAHSVNQLLESMEKKANFAQAIGRGEQEQELDVAEEDVLGVSLVEMQNSLQAAKIREMMQREQEEQQAWATKGMALFSEYMRVETNDITGFTYDILHHLTEYVHADIGAIYLVEKDAEERRYLTLTSSYAYQVRKYAEAQFEIGEGMVGRCAMEQKRIYLTDVPKGYVKISSGLGHEDPNSLVLVPIMMNDVLQGVLELARFGDFEEYVLRFIENVMGSFAATLVALRNNIQTQHLLQEARIRSEEISSQEEEMRQNMEELQTVQEEVARKSAELESWNRAMQSACCIVEYDTRGYLQYANNEYLSLLRLSLSEIQGHHHAEGMVMNAEMSKRYQIFWRELLNGQIKRNVRNQFKRNGLVLTFNETYAPILNEHGEVVKILKIAFNISEFMTEVSANAASGSSKLSFSVGE